MVAYIATNTKEMDKETLVNNLKEAGFIQTRDWSNESSYQKHIDDNDFIEVHITDNVGYCIEYYKEIGFCESTLLMLTNEIIPFS